MKINSFVENIFASVALVQQEPRVERPYKTSKEEYEIKKGDLVLLARTDLDEKPLYGILSVAHEPEGRTFHALRGWGQLKTLYPCYPAGHPCSSGLPPTIVSGPVDGCEYLMRESAVNPYSTSTWLLYRPDRLTGNRIYIGFENVMRFLLTTPGFEPHAGALAISWKLYKTI